MSELLKKYDSIDQSKLNEPTIKILNRVKAITADFTTDDEKNNKIAEQVLNEVMKKNPDAIKIVKREPKAKPAPKKVHKPKATHKPKGTHTPNPTPTAKSNNNIMSVAKEIQKSGESWKDAMERAKEVLKERKEKAVQKQKTELEKLYELVKTKKELQGFANSDIRRDSVRTAKVRGKRFVTKEGTTSNQYGTFPNKIGRKYWETRDRHADRLAPNYPKDTPLLASGGALAKDILKEIYEAQEKSTKGGFFTEFNSEYNYALLVFGDYFAIEIMNKNSREFPAHYYIYDANYKFLGGANSINNKSRIDYNKLTKADFVGTKFVAYKWADGGMFNTNVHSGTAFMDNTTFADGGGVKKNIKIKDWYTKTYPTDDLGEELDADNTFEDLWTALHNGTNVYDVLGVGDSLVRERVFEELSQVNGVDYNYVYKKWLDSDDYADGGSLPFMTDPNFGNFQDSVLENGGDILKLENELIHYKNLLRNIDKYPDYNKKNVEKIISELESKIANGSAGQKKYNIQYNIGKARYVVNYHDGIEKHKDGSNFYNIATFKNKKALQDFLTKLSKEGYREMGYNTPYADGGSLPFMTDPNFGNFQNAVLENGGSMADLTEQEFIKKYWGANVFTENPSQYFEIKKMSSSNDDKVDAFVKELKADGFTVKKRAYSDFTSVMGVKKKTSFELGGMFMNTDLAGHTGGGTGGLDPNAPLSGTSGTYYTGLVGETGALSSGELFMDGGAMAQNQQVINDASQSYVNYYLGEGAGQGIYKEGGSIPNNYEGRTPEDIWSSLSIEQRKHFLFDHQEDLPERLTGYYVVNELAKRDFNDSPKEIQLAFIMHVKSGQYANGGSLKDVDDSLYVSISKTEDDYWFVTSKPTTKKQAEEMAKLTTPMRGEVNDVKTVGQVKAHSKVIYAKGGFVGTVEFNVGDIVWQKDEKRYATVMNNYGNPVNGDGGDIRLDTTGNTPIFTYNKKTYENTGYNLVKVGEKGDTGKFTPEVLAEMKESANRLIDSRKKSKDKEGVAYYEEVYQRLLSGEFDSIAKPTISSETTYVPNADVKELSVVIKGELKKLTGSDIVNGVYVKNSAKFTSKVDANAVFAKILKDAKEAKRGKSKKFDASDLKKLNLEIVQKLVEAGYTEQQVRNIIFGYAFDNEIVADNELEYDNGIFSYEDSYVLKKIDALVEAKKNNEFALGIEYPDFDWSGIIKKYKISSKSKDLTQKRKGSSGSTENYYEVFIGENIVIGQNYGYKWLDADGKVLSSHLEKTKKVSDPTKQNAWQKEREQKAGFNGGYWYIVSSKIEIIDDVLKTLLAQKDGYCKEVSFYDETFATTLKENKIDFADGGDVNEVAKIKVTNGKYVDTWFLTKDKDTTHFYLSNTAQSKGVPYHVGQFRTEPFYEDLTSWLKGGANIDGKEYKGNSFADGGGVSGKLESGVYRVGKPTKVSSNLYEQKIVEIFDNGDISTASDYGRKLGDFKSQKYPIITKEQLEAQYKMANGGAVVSYDVVIDGDWDEPKKFKTFSLAKKWIYENIKNHDSLELVDPYGDTIYADGDSTKEDLDWLFSNDSVSFADGGIFDENDGFMKADNNRNFRFPERPVHVDITDEPIDLTDNVSYASNEVVVNPINEEMDLKGSGVRARMGYNPSDRNPEKMLAVNPRAFEYMDLPTPTSNKHKND